MTPEVRKKISEAGKGRCPSKETREKMSLWQKGKPKSPETCAKLSEYRGERASNWKGGVSFEPYCVKFDEPFKERCRNFFGRVCVECGKTEDENGKNLSVHHVNFDKMTCCNDKIPLYVALCQSCHAKTNYNREYWEKHFSDLISEIYYGCCYLPKEENL